MDVSDKRLYKIQKGPILIISDGQALLITNSYDSLTIFNSHKCDHIVLAGLPAALKSETLRTISYIKCELVAFRGQ